MAESLQVTNIGYANLKSDRRARAVTKGPKGMIGDYVPFYFAPRSPMLYAINRGLVEGYEDGQNPVVHLVAFAEEFESQRHPFVFTDGHAVVAFSQFFEELADLAKIDWRVMRSIYWNDTEADPDRKRRRQAEFLVHQFVPWGMIREIGVMDAATAQRVTSALANWSHRPTVTVRRNWYY